MALNEHENKIWQSLVGHESSVTQNSRASEVLYGRRFYGIVSTILSNAGVNMFDRSEAELCLTGVDDIATPVGIHLLTTNETWQRDFLVKSYIDTVVGSKNTLRYRWFVPDDQRVAEFYPGPIMMQIPAATSAKNHEWSIAPQTESIYLIGVLRHFRANSGNGIHNEQ